MPRATIAHTVNDIPLTVAAAAQVVGVSPSTLRTWDRRYGLSPSARTVGAHRRYTALDIARLERMCELIAKGVSACDAAHIVTTENIDELGVDYDVTSLNEGDLRAAALQGDKVTVRSILDKAISEIGLMRTWTELIRPAIHTIRAGTDVKTPGFCPTVMLEYASLQAIERLMKEAPEECECIDGPRVLVAGDHGRVIEVNVIGAALSWRTQHVMSLCTNSDVVDQAVMDYVTDKKPGIVVLVDYPCSQSMVQRIACADTMVFLSGENAPDMHGEHIIHLRSASATVDEILSMI